MRILQHNDRRLVLGGIPGGRRWMIALVLFGVGASAVVSYFAWATYQKADGLSLVHLPIACGFGMAQLFLWIGVVTLAVGRLRLELDRTTGRGEYRVRSPIIEAGKPAKFDLDHVHSVSLEALTEWRPGRGDGPDSEATVWRARLRLTKPRRAIVLDETENNRRKRVEAVAQQVADFLGKPLERDE